MIVYYADKRVNHDQIVSLEERFKYFRETYGEKDSKVMEKINKAEKPTFAIEKIIFDKLILPTDMDDLKEKLKKNEKH